MTVTVSLRLLLSLAAGALLGAAAPLPASAEEKSPQGQRLQAGDLVAICGDSITEQKLYSVYMENYFLMCQPAPRLGAFQAGWSGETSWGFLKRMADDVLPFRPTVATTCYGMNDGGYAVTTPERLKQYRDAMTGIVSAFKKAGVRFIVVGSPGVVDTGTFQRGAAAYNQTLADLSNAAREVAAKEGTAFADVHQTMLDAMNKAKAKHGKAYPVAGKDGVHPGPNGQLVMAYAFLKALGCDGQIGTITLDLKSGKAEATEGHQVLSSSQSAVELESTRYPYCFPDGTGDPNPLRAMLEFIPFNEDLNRYILVVKHAPAGPIQVTWGKQTKEFSAAALQEGINLAAAFPDNPFCAPFQAVQKKIQEQQAFETPATKVMLHSLGEWRKHFPDETGRLAPLTEIVLEKDRGLRAAAQAAVVPVRHTIQVTAGK